MTERPITFNSAMVNAILDGTKTQTRRPVKGDIHPSPYGDIGDRLVVKGSPIKLKITSIRLERLKDLSEGDAIAEGWPKAAGDFDSPAPGNGGPFDWFRSVWSDIYGPDSWDKNPYVWAITFRRLYD